QERIPSGDLEMRNLHRWAIVLGVAGVIQAPAPAQDIPPLPRQSGGNLIHNKSVQEELKLGSDQGESIVAARRKSTEKYRDELKKLIELQNQEALKPRDLTRQPLSVTKRHELDAKMDEEVLKALDAILKPEQTKRLKQIQFHDAAQRTGAGVFLYADVAKELQLTDKQKRRAQSIFNQSCHDVTALAFSGAPREEVPKLNKKAIDDVRSSLSDDQKKKLADLMGRPFEVKADALPRAPFGGGNAHLFSNERVQKELKLTKEQVKSVQDGLAKVQEKNREEIEKARSPGAPVAPGGTGGGLDPEQLAALKSKVGEENQKVIAEVLKPEQVKRLKQIELQLEGVFAVRSEEVVKALDLTDDQKRQMKTLVADLEAAGLNLDRTDPVAATKAWRELRKEAVGKVPSLLTPDQREKWEEMTGVPFQLEPEDASKDGPAAQENGKAGNATKPGFIKIEARGDLVRKGADYFLVVKQNGFRVVELLVRSNADKSPVNKILLSHKDCAVVLTGNLSWLPKGAQVNSDDDYALGIVISAEAQLRRGNVFDTTAPYVKFEAQGDPWVIDNSLYVRVQLQEKPAKKVTVFGQIGNMGQLMAVFPK